MEVVKMNKRVWINLVMVMFVAGLFLTVSCAKKTVVSDATAVEDQEENAQLKAEAEALALAEAEAALIAQQELEAAAILEAQIIAARERFENQDIHFEYDSSKLSPMAKTLLQKKAAWLKANGSVSVAIEGHCDKRGTTEYNLALGERRASAAKAYLVNLGISAARLDTISYGEEQPLYPGNTELDYQKNRRDHFTIK